mgnify:CR=1 FL=1
MNVRTLLNDSIRSIRRMLGLNTAASYEAERFIRNATRRDQDKH